MLKGVKIMATSPRDWNQDNVGKWLNSVNLGHLSIKFENLGINGQTLMIMDDAFINTTLRLNPAEKTAFTGALNMLVNSAVQQYGTMPYHSQNIDPLRTRINSETQNRKMRISHPNDSAIAISGGCGSSGSCRKPELKVGPATQLLDDMCRHSGWIRKRGGSHPNWKQRYMVLRLGHLYYYEKETSLRPKGCFSIQGYSVEACPQGSIRNKPWCLKLVPENPRERTYYVSTGAKHEMEKWMREIENEIDSFDDHLYDPVAIEDDDDEEETYEPMNPEELFEPPPDPEDHYMRISKVANTFPRISSIDRPVSPNTSNTLQPLSRDSSRENPSVPPRSRESLSLHPMQGAHTKSGDEEDPYYIKLVDSGEPIPPLLPHAPPTSSPLDLGPPVVGSLPVEGSSPLSQPRPPRRSTEVLSKPIITHEFSPERDESQEEEEENPYYIQLNELDDILPKHCQFGNIQREEAVRRLTMDNRGNAKFTRPGTYLIRGSSHQDVVHVLSVWTGTECKHYKMYHKDSQEEGKGYCLTHGKLFPSLPLLLEYYKQEELPKSPSITLSEPYHPLDH